MDKSDGSAWKWWMICPITFQVWHAPFQTLPTGSSPDLSHSLQGSVWEHKNPQTSSMYLGHILKNWKGKKKNRSMSDLQPRFEVAQHTRVQRHLHCIYKGRRSLEGLKRLKSHPHSVRHWVISPPKSISEYWAPSGEAMGTIFTVFGVTPVCPIGAWLKGGPRRPPGTGSGVHTLKKCPQCLRCSSAVTTALRLSASSPVGNHCPSATGRHPLQLTFWRSPIARNKWRKTATARHRVVAGRKWKEFCKSDAQGWLVL